MTAALASSLWSACWQGLAFVGFVWLVCKIGRNLPASLKAWLWWLASLKMVIGLVWAGIELPVLPPPEKSALGELNARLDLLAPKLNAEAGDWLQMLPSVLLVAWAIGVAAMVVSIAVQGFKLAGIRRRAYPADATRSGELARVIGAELGLPSRPLVLHSDEISAPMVAGLLRPALILPDDYESALSEEELRLCIAHELAHMHRRDLPMAVLPTVMQTLYFFFPPAWLARREWETEREAACDAEALSLTGAEPAGYGKLLVKLVSGDHYGAVAPALGATASYHTLKKRIQNMKHFKPARPGIRAATLGIASLALLLALPWQLTASPASMEDRNLVVNGGFEDSSNGWEEGSMFGTPPIKISVDRSTFHSGAASLRFERTAPGFSPVAMMMQAVPYNGRPTQIKVGLWAKAQNVGKFSLVAMFHNERGMKREWGPYLGDREGRSVVATHDWKEYTSTINIPGGTTRITLSLEMYGPGTVWVDDVTATYADGAAEPEDTATDVVDVKSEDLRAGNDPQMRYFLIGAHQPAPAAGYKLLVVLPGGDGGAGFNPFIRRIWKNALPPGYVIAQLVAPKWSDNQFETIVWPTRKQRWQGMKFATEDFIDKVVADVSKKHKVERAFTLSWSSGGPAAYAASMNLTSIKGSFVAMSVFRPEQLPPLFNAKGHAYYLYQSPDDRITRFAFAEQANKELKQAGAKTELKSYAGGHGWHGDVFGGIRAGIDWLEMATG